MVVAPVDRDNAASLRELWPAWVARASAGWCGGRACGLALAHHAPPDLQEQCLPLLQDVVAHDDASPAGLAYLMDRVLMHRGEPQIYRTLYQVRDGVLDVWPARVIPTG